MDNWVRNAVMLVVTLVWAIVVLVSLWRGTVPDAITWGVPGALWFALNPVLPKRVGIRSAEKPGEPDTEGVAR